MFEKKTKDGRSYWKIWSRKSVFPYEDVKKDAVRFDKGLGTEPGAILGSCLKSISMFKNEEGFTFVTYSAYLTKDKLTVKPDSDTISVKFKKGKTYVYLKSFKGGKKKYRNITYSLSSLERFLTQVMKNDGLEPHKISGIMKKIVSIILDGALEHKVLIKKPKLKEFKSAWNVLIFPCFQDLAAQGYVINLEGFLSTLQKKRDIAPFRESNIQECIRKVVGTTSKKLIQNIIEASMLPESRHKLHEPGYKGQSSLERKEKVFDTSAFWIAKILKPIMTIDHLQTVIEEYGKHRKLIVDRDFNTRLRHREILGEKRSRLNTKPVNIGSVNVSESVEYWKGFFNKNPHADFAHIHGNRRNPAGPGRKRMPNNSEVIRFRKFLQKFSTDRLIGLFQDIGCVFGRDSLNQKRIENRLFDTVNTIGLLRDTYSQWNAHKDQIVFPERFKDLKELHDDISRQYRRIKDPDFEIPMTKTVLESGIDGLIHEGMQIVVPKNRYTLMEWGETMRNCIASYAKNASRKECLILGIYKEGILIYNIEVNRRGEVRQFFGKGNSSPDRAERESIEKLLTEKKILGVKNSPVAVFQQVNHHTLPTATNVIPAWDDAEELNAEQQIA